MKALLELQRLGYEAKLKNDGQNVSLRYYGDGEPDPDKVKPLISEVKQRKEEAINYLKHQESDYEEESRKLERFLEEKGLARVNSEVLGEIVYL